MLPALTARTTGRWFGTVELSEPIFLADARAVATPRVVLGLGATLPTR